MEQRTSTTEEYHRCVNIVIEYINNHLGEEIDLEKLAEISHFSPYHFHRIMKAFLHEPLGSIYCTHKDRDCSPVTTLQFNVCE